MRPISSHFPSIYFTLSLSHHIVLSTSLVTSWYQNSGAIFKSSQTFLTNHRDFNNFFRSKETFQRNSWILPCVLYHKLKLGVPWYCTILEFFVLSAAFLNVPFIIVNITGIELLCQIRTFYR